MEKMLEVAIRVRSNSFSIDLKKTPKQKRDPKISAKITKEVVTTIHP